MIFHPARSRFAKQVNRYLMVIQSRVLIGAAQVPVDSLDSTAFDSCLDFLFVFFFFYLFGGLGFWFFFLPFWEDTQVISTSKLSLYPNVAPEWKCLCRCDTGTALAAALPGKRALWGGACRAQIRYQTWSFATRGCLKALWSRNLIPIAVPGICRGIDCAVCLAHFLRPPCCHVRSFLSCWVPAWHRGVELRSCSASPRR